MPKMVVRSTRSPISRLEPSATHTGASVASRVAFAIVVLKIARCQKNRSPANITPATTVAGRHGAEPPSRRAQIHRSGSASPTRQKALV